MSRLEQQQPNPFNLPSGAIHPSQPPPTQSESLVQGVRPPTDALDQLPFSEALETPEAALVQRWESRIMAGVREDHPTGISRQHSAVVVTDPRSGTLSLPAADDTVVADSCQREGSAVPAPPPQPYSLGRFDGQLHSSPLLDAPAISDPATESSARRAAIGTALSTQLHPPPRQVYKPSPAEAPYLKFTLLRPP